MTKQMWSVQFWQDNAMKGFNKFYGTRRQASAFARRCRNVDSAIANTTIKLEPILQTNPPDVLQRSRPNL